MLAESCDAARLFKLDAYVQLSAYIIFCNILRPIAIAREITWQITQCTVSSLIFALCVWVALPKPVVIPLTLIQYQAVSALSVDFQQISALENPRAFGCEYSLSPNIANWESFINCAIGTYFQVHTYLYLRAILLGMHTYSKDPSTYIPRQKYS